MDAQKKSLVAALRLPVAERDELKRATWKEAIREIAQTEPERLKFIDESACHLSLTQMYGWAKRGECCVYAVPGNSGPRQSIVALFSLTGAMERHQVQPGSLKGADFANFVEGCVVPTLSAGDVVIVDNARYHQVTLPSGHARTRVDRSGGSAIAVLARLFAGLQSDRVSLAQGQSQAAGGRSADARSPAVRH
jgi:hypothetical protein